MWNMEGRRMAGHEEIVEEMEGGVVGFTEEVIYIALGTKVKKEISNLLWVLMNFPNHKIIILHVHWPSQWIPISLGAKFLESRASKLQVANHKEEEKKRMNDLISRYKNICHKSEVQVEVQVIMRKDIFDGIKVLVGLCQAKRLVVGSRFMSRREDLLNCCQVWLVCNGKHVSTSEVILDHDERDIGNEAYQEPQALTFNEGSDEDLQFVTPPNEPGDEINNDKEEAESSVSHNIAKKEVDNVALLAKEMQELKIKLAKAEEQARLDKERITALEQMVARLKEENSDAETEIQALRTPHYCKEFSMEDLKRATKNFHDSHKIGEGGYGPVYKGLLCHTPVAIKVHDPKSKQGRPQYQQEVLVLSKIRHPNIVSLIGLCSESSALIYEYLENGNVEERMVLARKKKNVPPLSWQTRIRIIAEQRGVLIFLHNNKPHAIVHADLKLLNILLDNNNVSRLGDFGTARLIRSEETTTICRLTTPMGTVGYMDPIFFTTGELTPQSDIYSFGIIILRLLTGLPVMKIAEQVEEGLQMGALRQILDASAGEWPVVHVEKLLRLALKCCDIERRRRPDLVSEEWRTLEILSAIAGKQA